MMCKVNNQLYCNDLGEKKTKCYACLQCQGRRRRSGWLGLSRANNLELDQLADQLELYYSHAISGRSYLHVHFTDVIENAWHE